MCIMAATRLGQSPETDQSEIPNAEQILSALKKDSISLVRPEFFY